MTLYDILSSHMKSTIAARKRYVSDEEGAAGADKDDKQLTTFESEDITSSNEEPNGDVIND